MSNTNLIYIHNTSYSKNVASLLCLKLLILRFLSCFESKPRVVYSVIVTDKKSTVLVACSQFSVKHAYHH